MKNFDEIVDLITDRGIDCSSIYSENSVKILDNTVIKSFKNKNRYLNESMAYKLMSNNVL